VRPASALSEHRLRGWLVAAAVTALAAAVRLPALGRPRALVFDETYYVKDAWTLLHLGYESTWPKDPNAAFEAGDVGTYLTAPSFVVHPQFGKWVIALGEKLFGAQDPVGWRVSTAVAGILAVLLLTRIARRLFRSTALGALAGTLMAVDGLAIVHSRTGLLDNILMVLVLAAFGALLVDRDRTAARIEGLTSPPLAASRYGPAGGLRPWRLAAGVLLGLALGTKWSAIWYVAAFGLLTVAWDVSARHRAGVVRWWQGVLLRDVGPAFASLVPVAVVTYISTWASWFATSGGWERQWAATHPGEGVTWLPEVLRSWWHYHQSMWHFHTTLTSGHSYAAHAYNWLIQWRPTSFYYESPEPAQAACGADRCAQAVTSLGNPLIWWLGTLAIIAAVWWVIRHRDALAAVALTGVAAGWLPWLLFPERTIFTFYAIVFLPYLILVLVWAVRRSLERPTRAKLTAAVATVLLILAVSAFYWPVWTAVTVPFRFWQLHMWLPSWV